MSLLSLLIVLVLLAVLFGGYGTTLQPAWGSWSWSPVGLLVFVIIILFLLGRL